MPETEYENLFWQYAIDHSKITPDGKFTIRFTVDNREDFRKRVMSRVRGYRKTNVLMKEALAEAQRRKYESRKKNIFRDLYLSVVIALRKPLNKQIERLQYWL